MWPYSEDTMDVPIQGMAAMGIYTLEKDGGEVKSRSKMGEEEELLLQLTIHTVDEMPVMTFV
jgi:hypothetical protein